MSRYITVTDVVRSYPLWTFFNRRRREGEGDEPTEEEGEAKE
jgi:hypothetical protein